MTKTILITAAALAATLHAQNNFQNPAWFGAPNDAAHALRPDGQSGPVTGKPFSGVETRITSQVLSDGTPTNNQSSSKIFRDAEGRMREESGKRMILFDAPHLTNYTVGAMGCEQRKVGDGDSILIAATSGGTWISWQGRNTSPKRPAMGTGAAGSHPGIVTADLGYQTINGVSAHGTRQTVTIPAKTIGSDHDVTVVNERWYSDELGILIKSSNVDPRFGTSTYELSEINQSTPDASLFTPPTTCSER
jgi:hypothetical protein